MELGKLERARKKGLLDFSKLEERNRRLQREERWRRIGVSRYNKWHGRVKGSGIPEYLKKGEKQVDENSEV